jgi:hypothetical protein
MRQPPTSKSWESSLRAFRQQAAALPEGPDKIEMSLKVRSLEHAIEFRASIPVSAQRVKGIR